MIQYPEYFKLAMPFVFEHEGGLNNKVNDKGGATNWGVSLRFLKSINKDIDGDGDVDYMDIAHLTKEEATDIYFENFYKPFYNELPVRLSIKVFDTAINAGNTRSHILLQRSLNSLGSTVKVDGAIGPQTKNAIKIYDERTLLDQFCIEQKKFYDFLIAKDSTQKEFEKGWHNRAKWKPIV